MQNIKRVRNKIIEKDRVKIITPFNSFIHVYLCLRFDKNEGGFLPFLNGQRTHGILEDFALTLNSDLEETKINTIAYPLSDTLWLKFRVNKERKRRDKLVQTTILRRSLI